MGRLVAVRHSINMNKFPLFGDVIYALNYSRNYIALKTNTIITRTGTIVINQSKKYLSIALKITAKSENQIF